MPVNPGTIRFAEIASTPSAPPSGYAMIYFKTDNVLYILDSGGVETAIGSASFVSSLTGDVTGSGPGAAATTVQFVGGQTASNIAAATVEVEAATSAAVALTLVQRDVSGNASFVNVTATSNFIGNLTGNAATATAAVTAIDFTGTLNGDVTGTQSATSIMSSVVMGKTLVGYALGPNTPISSTDSVLSAFEKLQSQITNTSGSAITELSGDVLAMGPGDATATVVAIQTFAVSNATPSNAQVFVYNNITEKWTPVSISGDINISAAGVAAIQANVVTNAKLAQAPMFTLKGNNTGSTANVIDLTVSQVNVMLGTVTVVGAFDSQAPSANGLVISGNDIYAQSASASNPGMVNTIAQTFAGTKTFSAIISSIFQSSSANPAGAGIVRLANGDAVAWRNIANSADILLQPHADGILQYNGIDLVNLSAAQALTNKTINASLNTISNLVNANLSGSAGITGANIALMTVNNTNLAQMPANTVKANTAGVPGSPNDVSLGQVTEATSSVLVLSGWSDATIGSPTIRVLQAGSTQSGYLSSADWNTFNNTVATAITSLTSDVLATGPGAAAATVVRIQSIPVNATAPTDAQFFVYVSGSTSWVPTSMNGDATLADTGALTLATVNGSPGTFGSSTAIPTIIVNAKGLVTSITTNAVIAPAGTLTGTTLAANVVNSSIQNLGIQNANLNMGNNQVNNISQLAIGQASPGAATAIDIVNSTGATQVIQQTGYGGSVGFRARYANGTVGSPSATLLGNNLSFLSGRGYGSSQFAAASTGAINIIAGENFTNASNATYINFLVTATGSVTSSEKMRINSTGNVLIGTTIDDLLDLLQVNGNLKIGNGSGPVTIKFNGANLGTIAWSPGAAITYTLPPTQGAAGTVPVNDGAGNLTWTNVNTNIDGGVASSVYTTSQFINGGTP